MSNFTVAITAVTAVASLLSVIGSAFILICYAVLPLEFHFRHVLILNLAVSDFLNAVNNSAAGLYILAKNKGLDAGPACTFNGFAGQVTVQATDCTILVIAVSTVLAITRRRPISSARQEVWQKNKIALVCLAIWIFPFFTGFLALGMGWYAPATGDWCWLTAKPVYLRYVLTHGWRFLFIIIEICLYIYLDRHLRRHYQTVAAVMPTRGSSLNARQQESREPHALSTLRFSVGGETSETDTSVTHSTESGKFRVDEKGEKSAAKEDSFSALAIPFQLKGKSSRKIWSFMNITGLRGVDYIPSFRPDSQYHIIRKALLLNAYPLGYIALWIPGIVNRLVEATGHSSQVMQLLQASTQLVGLANALTYGWNERVAKQVKERFRAT